jgi:hypothetical protein
MWICIKSRNILLQTFQEFAPDAEKLHPRKHKLCYKPFYEIASKGEKICYKPSNNLHHTKEMLNLRKMKFCYKPLWSCIKCKKSAMKLVRICNL